MKQFRYSLETLLSIKKEQELEKKIALALANASLMTIENRLQELREAAQRNFLIDAGDLASLRAREGLCAKASNEAIGLLKPQHEAKNKYDQARQSYVKAQNESAALERLREKRWEQWHRKAKRKEDHDRDERAQNHRLQKKARGVRDGGI